MSHQGNNTGSSLWTVILGAGEPGTLSAAVYKTKMRAAPWLRSVGQARCRDAASPGLLQVCGTEVFTSKCFLTQVHRLISLLSQSLESNTECIRCLQQQLNSCTLVNLPRNPPAADTLLARHSGLRFTGAPLSDCRWYCCARVQMCYQIAVFIFSMLTLICQIGFNPLALRVFPTSTKELKVDCTPKQTAGIFMAVRLLLSAVPGKLLELKSFDALNLQQEMRRCVSFAGHTSAGNFTELPKVAQIRGDEPAPCRFVDSVTARLHFQQVSFSLTGKAIG